jgi:lysophospholipid acyltransferase (LPLAT)-like uncharacterized protein
MTAPSAPSPTQAAGAGPGRRRDRRIRWTARIGLALVRLLAATWRYRVDNREVVASRRTSNQPIIFVFWHGRMLPLLWYHRHEGIAILISQHGDGEIIARVAEALGYHTVRGSTRHGAGRALLDLIRTVREGREVAITPDGPLGPAESFATGAAVVAQRTHTPIIPVGVGANRAWRLSSWDRFLIPKPFARVRIRYGQPWHLASHSTRDAAAQTPALQERLRRCTADADA